tara:strand:+ start:311 stop:694 length:384 start_codon:yes stop_codon:yes gene_type:complete
MAQVTYQPLKGDALAQADNKAQQVHFDAFLAVNPNAVLMPQNIAEGAKHPFLSNRKAKDGGRTNRGKIMAMLTSVKGITFDDLSKAIKEGKLGGNTYDDVLAALYGGFSRSTSGYGVTSYLKVVANK